MPVIGIVFLLLIIGGSIKSCSEPAAPAISRAERMCSDQGQGTAWVMAGNFVKQRLRSPSTAKFPYKPDAYSYAGDCRHSIIGSVDSQNGFGAMLRSTFRVNMVYLPGEDKWRAEGLVIQ